jgi:hypothetical protein
VRNALVYVLNNFRKHIRRARGLDPCSSAPWFEGWSASARSVVEASPLARACTWLARIGWRRRGLIDVDECPRAPLRFARRGLRVDPSVDDMGLQRPRWSSTPNGHLRCRVTRLSAGNGLSSIQRPLRPSTGQRGDTGSTRTWTRQH